MSAKIGETKQYHVLSEARRILGISRDDLSKRVGLAVATLRKIESGERRLTEKAAWRIAIATGVQPRQLLLGSKGEVLNFQGKALAVNDYERSKMSSKSTPRTQIDRDVGIFTHQIELMLDASVQKTPACYKVFFLALSQTLKELEVEFALSDEMKKISKSYGLWSPYGHVRPGDHNREEKNKRRAEMYEQNAIDVRPKKRASQKVESPRKALRRPL